MNHYHITEFPTFIFFFCGEERDRMVGPDKYLLEAKIQQYTQTTSNQSNCTNSEERHNVEDQREEGSNVEEYNDGQMEEEEEENMDVRSDYFEYIQRQRFPNKSHVLGSSKETSLPKPTTSSPSPSPQLEEIERTEKMEKDNENDEYENEGPVPSLQSLRKAMEEMGFTPAIIEMVMKMDQSRDLSRLVQLATLVQEDSELTEAQIASMSEWEQAVSLLVYY